MSRDRRRHPFMGVVKVTMRRGVRRVQLHYVGCQQIYCSAHMLTIITESALPRPRTRRRRFCQSLRRLWWGRGQPSSRPSLACRTSVQRAQSLRLHHRLRLLPWRLCFQPVPWVPRSVARSSPGRSPEHREDGAVRGGGDIARVDARARDREARSGGNRDGLLLWRVPHRRSLSASCRARSTAPPMAAEHAAASLHTAPARSW